MLFRSGIAACFLLCVLPRARALPSLRTLAVALVFAASTTFTVLAISNASAAAAMLLQGAPPRSR